MEKPVEIVEKCEFSTAIPGFWNLAPRKNHLPRGLDLNACNRKFKIMLPGLWCLFFQKFGEKVCTLQKHHWGERAKNREAEKIFVEFSQK